MKKFTFRKLPEGLDLNVTQKTKIKIRVTIDKFVGAKKMKLPDGVSKMKRREESKSCEGVIINKKGKWKKENEIKKKPERKKDSKKERKKKK